MPDIPACKSFEFYDDSGNHPWMCPHGVFPATFVRIWGNGGGSVDEFVFVQVGEEIERAPIQDLKSHQMEMNWMGVVREIDEVPDLDRIESRRLGYGFVPELTVQQHRAHLRGWVVRVTAAFERQHSRFDRLFFLEPK